MGTLKRWWRGDGIHRPAEMIAARRWDLPDRCQDGGVAMGFADGRTRR